MVNRKRKRKSATKHKPPAPLPLPISLPFSEDRVSSNEQSEDELDAVHSGTHASDLAKYLIRSQPTPKSPLQNQSLNLLGPAEDFSPSCVDRSVSVQQTEPPDEISAMPDLEDTINQLISEVSVPYRAPACAPTERSSVIPNPALEAPKRPYQPGSIRKLGQLVTNPVIKTARAAKTTISGHRQAAVPSSRLQPNCVVPPLVLAVSRRTSFTVFLRRALEYLKARKTGEVRLMAMGCAVSMCLSLAMAIEASLELGTSCTLSKTIKTGTVIVGDEITPKNEASAESELVYQTRAQASIDILLTLTFPSQLQPLTAQLFPSTSSHPAKKKKK